MNKDIWEGNWQQFQGEIKKMWGWLTNDDIKEIEGDHQKILGKLQEHYGYSKEEALTAIEKLHSKTQH